MLSGSAFLVGALLVRAVSSAQLDVGPLVLFGAGSFVCIGASDLVPEIKAHGAFSEALTHLAVFVAGVLWMLALGGLLHH